jgi:hypothetical protein
VCLANDAAALSAASMLQSLLRSIDVAAPPIFVRLRQPATFGTGAGGAGSSGAGASGPAPTGLDALTPFGGLEAVLTGSDFLSSAPDAAARAFHEAYVRNLPPGRESLPANQPWERLQETFRRVNRAAVEHIPAKLASAGIDPSHWLGVAGLPRLQAGEALAADPEQLEALSILEHERWNAQRRMDGWRGAPEGGRDDARRQNPALKDWEQLSDELKGYDRDFVRQTDRICRGP